MKRLIRPEGGAVERPFLRELEIRDPIWTRAREAFGRILVRLRLRRPRLKFADREHWAPMAVERARGRAIRLASNGSREAIRTAVLAVSGVTSCRFREDDGTLPPRSFEMLVEGGEDARVAEAIFLEKAAGVGTCGTSSVVVGAGNVIRFTRPFRRKLRRADHPQLPVVLVMLLPTLLALLLAAAVAWVLLR